MGKYSKKLPNNMENAYNSGKDVVDKANKLPLSAPNNTKGFKKNFGW